MQGSAAPRQENRLALAQSLERVGSLVFAGRGLRRPALQPHADAEVLFERALAASAADVAVSVGRSAVQHALCTLASDLTGYAFCLPPGIRVRGHPAASVLEQGGASSSECVAASFSVFSVPRGGRRAGRTFVQAGSAELGPLMRSATALFCRYWNHPEEDGVAGEAFFAEFRSALAALVAGRDAPLRDLALRRPPLRDADRIGDTLFDSAWVLLDWLGRVPPPEIAAGLWDDPGDAARRLRVRLRLAEQLSVVMLAAHAADTERLRLTVLDWLSVDAVAPPATQVLPLLDLLVLGLSQWRRAALRDIAAALRRAGVLRSSREEQAFGEQRPGTRPVGLSEAVAVHAEQVLLSWGAWAVVCRQFHGAPPPGGRAGAGAGTDGWVLVRRLCGLRLCGGMTVAEAATRVGLGAGRARDLLYRKHREHWSSGLEAAQVVSRLLAEGRWPAAVDPGPDPGCALKDWLRTECGDATIFDGLSFLLPAEAAQDG